MSIVYTRHWYTRAHSQIAARAPRSAHISVPSRVSPQAPHAAYEQTDEGRALLKQYVAFEEVEETTKAVVEGGSPAGLQV